MAAPWYGSHFLSLDDDELDDVFEPAPSTASEVKSQEKYRLIADATSKYEHGYVADSPSNSVSHIDTDCQGLVTLHSLSGGRDSGYVPSPSSFHSFTFSSDEDEPTDSPEKPYPGVTPPITIPHSCLHPPQRCQASHHSRQEASHEVVQHFTPIKRGRSKSCPAASQPSVLPHLLVPHRLTVTPVPAHGSTFRIPVTGTNGQQHLQVHPHKTTNSTVQGARDQMEEEGALGHQRRVLVLALPDLVVEREGHYTDSNTQTPPTPVRTSRVRAFSCEVTLAEEVGRKLRWIADSFSAATSQSSETPPLRNSNRSKRW